MTDLSNKTTNFYLNPEFDFCSHFAFYEFRQDLSGQIVGARFTAEIKLFKEHRFAMDLYYSTTGQNIQPDDYNFITERFQTAISTRAYNDIFLLWYAENSVKIDEAAKTIIEIERNRLV